MTAAAANDNGRPVVLSVESLHKRFGERVVLEDVSLQVREGEILVVMGPSGCGKSTLLRCMIGALRPDRGRITIFGDPVAFDDRRALDRLRLRFGVMFQGGALFTSQSVGDNVAMPLRRHTQLPEETIAVLVKLKLSQVGLTDAAALLPSEISGGMIKRAALARALALDPRLVLCDEPSAGLDPVTIAVIDELMVNLVRALRVTLVVVTHEMTSAFRIADRMIMLYQGRVVCSGTPQEVRDSPDPIVRQFTTGLAVGPITPVTGKALAADLLEGAS
jgi:phospholipid/cholesterol/gamma-HCH transport system ATP-binding protein